MLASDPNRTQLGVPPTVDPNKTIMGKAPSINATQTIKPVQCPVCKIFNPAGMMFCVECGLIFDRALPGDVFGAPAVQLPVLVDDSGREYPIRPGENLVGREGDIELTQGLISRKHAKIVLNGSTVTVEELGSTNGSQLNGVKLVPGEAKTLQAGDRVEFGGFGLVLSLPGATNKTQIASGNKTAAIMAPPRVERPAGELVSDTMSFDLKPGLNTFGRRADNDVAIVDPYVSGKHGVIEIADDGVYLTDVGSTNGTLLNEAKLTANMRTKLGPDDVIRLGALEFRVVLADPGAETQVG